MTEAGAGAGAPGPLALLRVPVVTPPLSARGGGALPAVPALSLADESPESRPVPTGAAAGRIPPAIIEDESLASPDRASLGGASGGGGGYGLAGLAALGGGCGAPPSFVSSDETGAGAGAGGTESGVDESDDRTPLSGPPSPPRTAFFTLQRGSSAQARTPPRTPGDATGGSASPAVDDAGDVVRARVCVWRGGGHCVMPARAQDFEFATALRDPCPDAPPPSGGALDDVALGGFIRACAGGAAYAFYDRTNPLWYAGPGFAFAYALAVALAIAFANGGAGTSVWRTCGGSWGHAKTSVGYLVCSRARACVTCGICALVIIIIIFLGGVVVVLEVSDCCFVSTFVSLLI